MHNPTNGAYSGSIALAILMLWGVFCLGGAVFNHRRSSANIQTISPDSRPLAAYNGIELRITPADDPDRVICKLNIIHPKIACAKLEDIPNLADENTIFYIFAIWAIDEQRYLSSLMEWQCRDNRSNTRLVFACFGDYEELRVLGIGGASPTTPQWFGKQQNQLSLLRLGIPSADERERMFQDFAAKSKAATPK